MLLFDILSDFWRFQQDDDCHNSTLTRSLKAQHFPPQHMNSSKQYCHLHTPNDVKYPLGILQNRKIP